MKVGAPATGPLGDWLEVWTIRESNDPQTTIKWTMCIYDKDNRLVFMDVISHAVGIDPDIKVHRENIDYLSSDVYRVNIYYGDYLLSGCDGAPADQLRYMFYIHKGGSDVVNLRMHMDWFPERNYIFVMYVRDGIPFYKSTTSRVVGIPANADVFVEITGSDNNAYVRVVNTSSDISVLPNTTIPFRAVLRIRLNAPFAQSVANMYAEMLGFGRGVVVNIVDDYTFDLEIVKTEVGLSGVAATIAILLLIVILALVAVVIVSMVVQVENRKLNIMEGLIKRRNEIENKYLNEYEACTNDECRTRVERKYLHILQGYDAAIGSMVSTLEIGRCDGIKLGGVCVPWWVVAIAVFLAGLLVISAVR
jgi:hypothetical protein